MTALSYLMDEHVDAALAVGGRRRAPDLSVWRIGEPGVPSLGTLDPQILVWCEASNAVLVTNNRASMPGHLTDHLAAGHHVPGIFVLNDDLGLGETIEELLNAAYASLEDGYRDQIRFLPLD